MGASDWSYEIRWQPDLQAALDQLCAEQFTAGEYYRNWEDSLEYLDDALEEFGIDDIDDTNTPGWTASLEAVRTGGLPLTHQAAVVLSTTEGLHSILDCPTITDTPAFASITAFAADESSAIFGTTQPTTESARSVLAGLDTSQWTNRWEGRYIIGHHANGTPATIHFIGFSGD